MLLQEKDLGTITTTVLEGKKEKETPASTCVIDPSHSHACRLVGAFLALQNNVSLYKGIGKRMGLVGQSSTLD